MDASPQTVRVEVTDAGPGFAVRPRVAGQDPESGWGLYLVDALSDRWGTERGGRTRIWFEIDHGSAAPAA